MTLNQEKEVVLTVCDTCPWRKANHGKPHPARWFTAANLRRLWSAVRRGEAPGMVCHSSDPNSPEYGGTALIKADNRKRECGGLVLLVIKHVNDVNRLGLDAYFKKWRKYGMTARGVVGWVERYLSGNLSAVSGCDIDAVATVDEHRVETSTHEQAQQAKTNPAKTTARTDDQARRGTGKK